MRGVLNDLYNYMHAFYGLKFSTYTHCRLG
jgi:hypothetical protein